MRYLAREDSKAMRREVWEVAVATAAKINAAISAGGGTPRPGLAMRLYSKYAGKIVRYPGAIHAKKEYSDAAKNIRAHASLLSERYGAPTNSEPRLYFPKKLQERFPAAFKPTPWKLPTLNISEFRRDYITPFEKKTGFTVAVEKLGPFYTVVARGTIRARGRHKGYSRRLELSNKGDNLKKVFDSIRREYILQARG